MTIIRPNKHNRKMQNLLIGLFGFCVVALVWGGIVMYGMVVDFRHDLGVLQKDIQDAELQNVELKNSLYGIVDLDRLEERAKELGLIKERNPDYLSLTAL